MGLPPGLPPRVHAESNAVNPETYPSWATITCKFPARINMRPMKLTWYEGSENGKRNLPKLKLPGGQEPTDNGCLLVGENS